MSLWKLYLFTLGEKKKKRKMQIHQALTAPLNIFKLKSLVFPYKILKPISILTMSIEIWKYFSKVYITGKKDFIYSLT